MNTLHTVLSRRWRVVTLVVLLAMGVMIRLGIWQLDRLQQRKEANEALRTALVANPIDLTTAPVPADVAGWYDRAAMATGTYDFNEQVVLKVQNWEGQAGVHLIAPLVFADGVTAVLVDRGWIPDALAAPANWPDYDELGTVSVTGSVARSQLLTRGGEAIQPTTPQQEWYRVDVAALENQLPYTLLPIYLIQAPDATANADLPYRTLPEADLSEGNHLNYAIQWFLFTLILGGGYLIYVTQNAQTPVLAS